MYEGQPLRLNMFLPHWISTDDFYVAMTGLTAFLCIMAIGASFNPRNNTVAQVKAIQERRRTLQRESTAPKKRRGPDTSSVDFMRRVVGRLQLVKKNQIGNIQSRLIEAGFRGKDALVILAFFNLVMPLLMGALGMLLVPLKLISDPKWESFNYAWPVLFAYIGLKLPSLYVGSARRKRYVKVQRSLPDVLDLMTICAEAGLSLNATLERVSRELAVTYPEMSQELALTSIEIGFLPDRNKALTNLAARCTLPEVRGIVSVLVQTEKYGTPIAQALRVLSSEFRMARMLRAEQKAARLPALMTVPMILFILPTLFIVIISPAMVKLFDTVK